LGIIGTSHKSLEKIEEETVSQFVLVTEDCEDDQIIEDEID
jgi:hypothetical protein